MTIGLGDIEREIVAEPFEAWRAWKIRPEIKPSSSFLWSWGIGPVHWSKGVNHAICMRSYHHGTKDHLVPAFGFCACGFWGFKDPQKLADALERPRFHYAWGKIKLWGRVIEETYGYRGEHAKIEEVILVPSSNGLNCDNPSNLIESFYEVPVSLGDHPDKPRTMSGVERKEA